jgi:hypothetical protein
MAIPLSSSLVPAQRLLHHPNPAMLKNAWMERRHRAVVRSYCTLVLSITGSIQLTPRPGLWDAVRPQITESSI